MIGLAYKKGGIVAIWINDKDARTEVIDVFTLDEAIKFSQQLDNLIEIGKADMEQPE